MRVTIPIKSYLGVDLKTAELAIVLSSLISSKKVSVIDLDFTGIEFMSKLFAEQFYIERKQLLDQGTIVFIVNMEEGVAETVKNVNKLHKTKTRQLFYEYFLLS